jgi:hypothetical protein
MTECNECNGDQFYVGGRRRGADSFPEKKVTFCFNRQRNLTQMRGVGELEVQKILKSVTSSRRNQSLLDAPVIKPIGRHQEVRA